MALLVSSSSTAVLSPCSTLNTPGGSPASAPSSASHSEADGSFSDGLSTTVLPAAMAIGKNHIGTMTGKLNGLMMPTAPSGWRIEYTSTFVEAFSVKPPLSRCGMPQANSTTSWPRLTSPSASETTLPCSLVMILASSPLCALSSSRKANNAADRLANDVSRQAGNATAAASITARASSTPPNTTSPVTVPIAGLVIGAVEALVAAKKVLFIQWLMLVGIVFLSFGPPGVGPCWVARSAFVCQPHGASAQRMPRGRDRMSGNSRYRLERLRCRTGQPPHRSAASPHP